MVAGQPPGTIAGATQSHEGGSYGQHLIGSRDYNLRRQCEDVLEGRSDENLQLLLGCQLHVFHLAIVPGPGQDLALGRGMIGLQSTAIS